MNESPVAIVERFFERYLPQNRAGTQEIAGADLVFTSPQDDHIDRAAFFGGAVSAT